MFFMVISIAIAVKGTVQAAVVFTMEVALIVILKAAFALKAALAIAILLCIIILVVKVKSII